MTSTIPSQNDLEFADYLLRLRGMSLRKLVNRLKNGCDTAPIVILGMKPNAETLQAFDDADNHPERMHVCNSLEQLFAELKS